MTSGVADFTLTTLRLPISLYNRLPEAVTAPLNLYSGGGRCDDETIAFVIATCRVEEIFTRCRQAGWRVPLDATLIDERF